MTNRNSYRYSRLSFFNEASIKKLKSFRYQVPTTVGISQLWLSGIQL